MRLLLDTHAFLWFITNDPKLSAAAKTLIADPQNQIVVSPASYWEIGHGSNQGYRVSIMPSVPKRAGLR